MQERENVKAIMKRLSKLLCEYTSSLFSNSIFFLSFDYKILTFKVFETVSLTCIRILSDNEP